MIRVCSSKPHCRAHGRAVARFEFGQPGSVWRSTGLLGSVSLTLTSLACAVMRSVLHCLNRECLVPRPVLGKRLEMCSIQLYPHSKLFCYSQGGGVRADRPTVRVIARDDMHMARVDPDPDAPSARGLTYLGLSRILS